ncbi:general transcription factor IIF subunit 2-like isoform X2 [Mytilus galloprovincialis]|uniref:general transcription factor IIF subunit 2-like isoform X1 n=1 Tax=Mytilus galloprovincialis TaxID=29158 RepID=UPI003F7C6CCF
MSMPLEFEKAHTPRDVDLNAAGRGVWLVKVPKYLSEKWSHADGGEVGKLKITRSKFPGQKPDVVFSLNDKLVKSGDTTQSPKDHKMVLTGLGNQNLVVFSETPPMITADSGAKPDHLVDKLGIEGKVIQRAECRPIADNNYLKLKRLQVEAQNKPKREVIQISEVVNAYKPISDHKFNIEHNQKLKNEGKRLRDSKDVVMEKLFAAFEKHQYYNVKDLVRVTNQPITYLKEILKEICVYNMKAPHRNMWELKPEYRHYKDDEKT